jgi:hypothetical protein
VPRTEGPYLAVCSVSELIDRSRRARGYCSIWHEQDKQDKDDEKHYCPAGVSAESSTVVHNSFTPSAFRPVPVYERRRRLRGGIRLHEIAFLSNSTDVSVYEYFFDKETPIGPT